MKKENAAEIESQTPIFAQNKVNFKKTGIGYYLLKSKMDKGTVKFILSDIDYQNLYILPSFLRFY